MSIIIKGKVWKFGDDINTDYMAPSFAVDAPWEVQKKAILHIHKAFTEEAKPGDVIVAGKNFGCGSSRENAPTNLKRLGIGCVVAESFGRIFFRNCIAVALPVLAVRGVADSFEEGDILELDFEHSLVRNISRGKEMEGKPLTQDLVSIVQNGGMLAMMKRESMEKGSPNSG
jgi:3-isopropylmalate/(R)-2-methylmalate dehydratase small subunit